MTVKLIVAKAENDAIGKGNDLIWRLPADLKFFKATTLGHTLIMGRKTFESIGKPLPGRTTIIITRDKGYKQEGCKIAHSIEEALSIVENDDSPFIAGGATIYQQALDSNLIDEMIITEVHSEFEADAFFPKFDLSAWKELAREKHTADEKNKYDYSFVSYRKI
ncbi:MAG: dihydrofolate reductase [Bacteroidota bacterium]